MYIYDFNNCTYVRKPTNNLFLHEKLQVTRITAGIRARDLILSANTANKVVTHFHYLCGFSSTMTENIRNQYHVSLHII